MNEAQAMYHQALQGKEKACGPDHIKRLSTVNSLAVLYSDQGRINEAEAMYQRALRGYENALGADIFTRYRPALNTMQNLADLKVRQGQRIAARELYVKACGGLELLGLQYFAVQCLHDTISHWLSQGQRSRAG